MTHEVSTANGAFVADLRAVAEQADRNAFARLFGHFAPRVKAYLMRLGADSGTAEELVQEVMLTVWRRAQTYDPDIAGVGTWIFTIARNRRIDALRRANRPELDPSDPSLVPEAAPMADSVVMASQMEGELTRAMRTLPPEQLQLLRLSYYENKSHGDISKELNLPLGTVKSRLRLAVSRLRSTLEQS